MAKSTKWKQIKQIFSTALDLEGPERLRYIKNECKDNIELLDEVLSLIKAHETQGALDRPIDDIRLSAISVAKNERLKGKKIGKYKIVKELGYGGMGSVYLAERADSEFNQNTALKLLHGPLATEKQIQRFKAERQILASFNHQFIAKLFDGGITEEGQPYLVMEYIEGLPIDQYCNHHQLTIKERLTLFLDVCDAVQYAHQKLVVHRDLKPSNIFITTDGTVKLLDFGIAKVLDPVEEQANKLTQTSLLPITPAYASPEQIRNQQITTSSDLYQLGLVLYELLTGCSAFRIKNLTPAEVEKTICESPATRPSSKITKLQNRKDQVNASDIDQISQSRKTRPVQLKKALLGDLDTIVLKALRKDPDDRYKSVGHLMDDIRRHLENLPVLARPATIRYRFKKWYRRHKVAAIASFIVLISLSLGASIAIWQAKIANQAAEQANAALAETEQALSRAESLHAFILDLFRAAEPDRPRNQLPSTEELLALGAQRALDVQSASEAERFGMLLAIGEVYVELGREEQAMPLLEAAVDIGKQNIDQHSKDLGRALDLQAVVALREFRISDADSLLTDAESIVNNSGDAWYEFANIREHRAQLETMRGNYKQALSLIEPVYEEVRQMREIEPDIYYRVGARLASVHRALGDLDSDLRIRSELAEVIDQTDNSESFSTALFQTGLAGTQFRMGLLTESEENIQEAIELYDQIFEHPTEYRAITTMRLGLIRFYSGLYDEALGMIERAADEWALAQGRQREEHEFFYFLKGELLSHIDRWAEAKQNLVRAKELFEKNNESSAIWITIIDAQLAKINCRQGDMINGQHLLQDIQTRETITTIDAPDHLSKIHESHAVCLYLSGEPESALEEINQALEIFDFPGYALILAQRKILKAYILHSLERFDEVTPVLKSAEQLFLDLNLSKHPLLEEIEQTRKVLLHPL